jgi:hypothetical protein
MLDVRHFHASVTCHLPPVTRQRKIASCLPGHSKGKSLWQNGKSDFNASRSRFGLPLFAVL